VARESARISPTAYFTAQAWVKEGFPNAELFDTRTGRLLFGTATGALAVLARYAPSLAWHEEFLYVRHYAYEERLRQLAPDFVVEIGAGLSSRGLTFSYANPRLVYVEVDLPKLVAAKRRLLARTPVPRNYYLCSGDVLSGGFFESLPARPDPGMRVVVLSEGVTDYFDRDQKRRAWSSIAAFLARCEGGRYLFEAYTRERLRKYPVTASIALAGLSVLVGRPMEKQLFSTAEEVANVARSAGFGRVEPLDLSTLNTSRHHPPLDYRHFDLFEAHVP
jgi:O-methyltransferase involved in polyketide biosynthesis